LRPPRSQRRSSEAPPSPDDELGAIGWVAVGSFAAVGAAVLLILWPRHEWYFSVDAEDFIADYLEPADDRPLELAQIHRDLAIHMARSHKANREQLRRLLVAFRVGVILLVGEVMAWIVALIAQGS
jgi:hypothetical protein